MTGILALLCVGFTFFLVVWIFAAIVRAASGSTSKKKDRARRGAGRVEQPAATTRQPPGTRTVSRAEVGPVFTITISGDSPSRQAPDDARWHGVEEPVGVAGHAIPGGLVYVGQNLARIGYGYGTDPALINPRLDVERDPAAQDWTALLMPYWPSYSDVGPACRGAYLRWLGTGRRDPTVGIGYVFLFFYGLERRLLHDGAKGLVPDEERRAIVREVEALLSVYGGQSSFRKYAGEFLAAVRIQAGTELFSTSAPPSDEAYGEFPLALRVGLAEIVARARPIPAEWALAWVRCHPNVSTPTPARRCPDELARLFAIRYAQRFEQGLTLRPNKTKLAIAYRPASASFGGAVQIPVGDLRDVTALSAPVAKIKEVFDTCASELDAYSRLLGRNPDAGGSVAAAAVLPPELAPKEGRTEARPLSDFVQRKMSTQDIAVVECAELMGQWPSAQADGKLAKAEAVTLAQFLQKSNYGMDPDVRFGGRVPKPAEKVVLFPLPPGASAAPSPQFRGAAALLSMAVLVAQADGSVSEAEEEQLISHLESGLHLDAAERVRLHGHLRWLMANGVKLGEVKKRLDHVEPAKRQAIGSFLVGVAAADGRLERKEIDILTKLYGLLGVDEGQLYSDLHGFGLSGGDAGPVAVATGEKAKGYAIPSQPGAQSFALDPARVQAKMQESAAVAALLQDIFTEDETPAATSPDPGKPTVEGLDDVHAAFVREMADAMTLSRIDLEGRAARLGLMPDGALEVVNERAFELCGEALFEGDDPIAINPNVMKELMA